MRDLGAVERSRTVLIWDPPASFPSRIGGRTFTESHSPAQWIADRAARGAAPYSVRFTGAPDEESHLLAAIAWALPGAVVVFDEAGNLMTYGVAPSWLRRTITGARHRAVSLWFAAQSPTLLDKTILRNADRAEIGALGYERDRITLAKEFEDDSLLELADAKPGTFHTFNR